MYDIIYNTHDKIQYISRTLNQSKDVRYCLISLLLESILYDGQRPRSTVYGFFGIVIHYYCSSSHGSTSSKPSCSVVSFHCNSNSSNVSRSPAHRSLLQSEQSRAEQSRAEQSMSSETQAQMRQACEVTVDYTSISATKHNLYAH